MLDVFDSSRVDGILRWIKVPRHRSMRPAALHVIGVVLLLSAAARAEWTVTLLHPDWASGSYAYGVQNGQQVGTTFSDTSRASLWTGTASSWVDLHPVGATRSSAAGVDQGQQVGTVTLGNVRRASLWSGTAASWTDLTPAGGSNADATAIHGGQQVGTAYVGGPGAGTAHASLWHGTAASWVDLHPPGANYSFAHGVRGGQQVGAVHDGSTSRASLWSGTAESWVDLHPAGASSSNATAVHNGQQVGSVNLSFNSPTEYPHASLWNGTSASWVDLHPHDDHVITSEATDVYNGHQVGSVFYFVDPTALYGNKQRASYWNGTAESWEDLSVSLPGFWVSSYATGVWTDDTTIYVVGYGISNPIWPDMLNPKVAVLWTKPIPEPTTSATLAMITVSIGSLLWRRAARIRV